MKKKNDNERRFRFAVHELVCPHVHEKFGDNAWMFLDKRLLETLYVIREHILKVPMIVNTWKSGGEFSQRGLRCNLCGIVKKKTQAYLSAHVTGKGIDFHTREYSAEECREKIIASAHLLPCPIRLEKDVNWVHLDVYDPTDGEEKTVLF